MTVQGEKPYDLQRLEQRARPLTLHHARVTESTNDWAKREMQAGGVQTPALFVADSQTAGRGRRGNAWWSPRGNIAATFAFSHDPHLAFGLLPLLAGLAVRRALADLSASEEIGLKWPNDLIARQRKVAGLLCERLQGVDLLGIGVNVNAQTCDAPTELRGRIIALRELSGKTFDLTDTLVAIGQQLRRAVGVESESAAREMLAEYSHHHWPTGKNIEVIDTDRAPLVRGRCGGVDAQGRLVVTAGQQTHALLTGSIVSVSSAPGSGEDGHHEAWRRL